MTFKIHYTLLFNGSPCEETIIFFGESIKEIQDKWNNYRKKLPGLDDVWSEEIEEGE